MQLHQKLFVFDIETIPDTDAIFNLTGSETKDVELLRKELEEYHLEITKGKNPFPRQPFHKVVAVSFLEAEIHRDGNEEYYTLIDLRSGGEIDTDEAGLVKGFFHYLGKVFPRLVTFNGRGFDLPVMKYRAMAHGISAPWLYHSGDKWNNYSQRYSNDWHCDLIETLSDYGASARIKMNEACSILGLPGKFGVDGSKVTDMYDTGDIDAIRNYCETDVLNTYLLYLRYMQHRGNLSKINHNKAIEDVLIFIDSHKKNRGYLGDFYDAWNKSSDGKFTL
jgi:predicted PolB exonuclease-like 3'-5' exonuclease